MTEETNDKTSLPAGVDILAVTDGQPSPDGNGQPDQPVDEASASVAAALRTSFLALKIVLVALVVIYLGSGYFQSAARAIKSVVVQFGQIQGQGTDCRARSDRRSPLELALADQHPHRRQHRADPPAGPRFVLVLRRPASSRLDQ